MSIFSDKLTYLMKRDDMSDDRLGDLVGVNRTTVSRWRTGERSPKMEKLPEIASIFKVDPRIFVGEVPDNDITNIYNQLTPNRKDNVYHFAEQQLEEQNKVVSFPTKDEKQTEDDFAAHLVDPTRKFTEEEIDGIKAYLNQAKEDYLNKNK